MDKSFVTVEHSVEEMPEGTTREDLKPIKVAIDEVETEGTMVIAVLDKGDHVQAILKGAATDGVLANCVEAFLRGVANVSGGAAHEGVMRFIVGHITGNDEDNEDNDEENDQD